VTGPVVHTYRAAESGLLVNSYLVEGEQGIVVVDTNLLVSDIAALRARLEALHKPLRAILVTHPHPDHFNGVLSLVRDSEVPVYATAGVGRVITEIAAAKRAQWSPVYGQEWPAETYYPNSLLADGARVAVDELSFTVHDIGAAESHADSYVVLSADGSAEVAFTGDLFFHGMHPYTADAHSALWLAALDVLARDLAGQHVGTLYPGHGDPAGPELLAGQRRYLLYYRELIRRLSGGEPRLPEAAKSELGAAMRAFLPDAPLAWMIELGADAVAAELAGEGVRQDALHAARPLRAAGQRAGPGHHDVRDGLGLGRVGERERQAVRAVRRGGRHPDRHR
jgi:glyoxylase-like metal-dependent hydrolase (beta-lactamase superfamily II)